MAQLRVSGKTKVLEKPKKNYQAFGKIKGGKREIDIIGNKKEKRKIQAAISKVI